MIYQHLLTKKTLSRYLINNEFWPLDVKYENITVTEYVRSLVPSVGIKAQLLLCQSFYILHN